MVASIDYDDAMILSSMLGQLTLLDIVVIILIAALLIGLNIYGIMTREKW